MDAPPELLLALLYAGPGSAVVRVGERLEVRPASRADGEVVLTQDEVLAEGVGRLLELVA